MKYIKYLLAILIVTIFGQAATLMRPTPAHAANSNYFNAGNIIDDSIFFNKNTMNAGDIQNFLNSKVPSCQSGYTCLNNYSLSFGSVSADAYCGAIGGGTQSAANIIFNVAQACNINPEVLLVLLQKEQGLIASSAPSSYQYKFATGFCVYDNPSSEPAACQGTDGFFNQVYYAARQYRKYTANSSNYTYQAGRNSSIPYSPAGGCAAPYVTIQDQATANLYNYTPYQPNQAALNNLYGTGDSCSSYGNRNFWRDFNDWFGPTTGNGFTVAYDSSCMSACQQYVIYGSIKQAIPSTAIKIDWGLANYDPIAMNSGYLGSITSAGNLDRLFRINGGSKVYLVDGGKSYWITSQQMLAAWNNFDGASIASVPNDLAYTPTYQGGLSYAIKTPSSNNMYMVDGGDGSSSNNNAGNVMLRQYPNTNVLQAFEGDSPSFTTITDTAFFNQMTQGSSLTASGFTVQALGDPNQYQVIAGQKMYLSGSIAALYNQAPETVSTATLNRLINTSPASQFIRLPGDGVTIYMVDNGQTHAVSSLGILQAWMPTPSTNTNILDSGFLNLLTTGSPLNTLEADVSGQLYVMDSKALSIPTAIDSAFRVPTPFTASSALISLYSSATATKFVKSPSAPSVYLMDGGTKRHIVSAGVYALWAGNQTPTLVSDQALSQFTTANDITSNYITNGSTNVVVDNGVYYTATSSVSSDWGFGPPISVNASTIASLTSGGSLSNTVRSGNGYYYMKYGQSHLTFDTNLANIWGINTAGPNLSQSLVNTVPAGSPLTIFVRSTNTSDNRIFVADSGNKLYTLSSVQQVQNYGYISGNMLQLTPTDINAMTITNAQNIFQQTNTTNYAVLDSGSKRPFSSGTVQNSWLTSGNQTSVSDFLWNFMPTGSVITGSIKGSAPNIYAIQSGQKDWIQSWQTYSTNYSPYTAVSDYLISVLPSGPNIP